MTVSVYHIRQCDREGCGLRYPVVEANLVGERCPRCRASTHLVERLLQNDEYRREPRVDGTPPLEALLDNIRSAWNVGSIFRSADGIGLSHLHLCGITPTPESPKVVKTSLGAETVVEWSYHPDGVSRVRELKSAGKRIWALEQTPHAQTLWDSLGELTGPPLVLVVGNELTGVDPGIVELCERVVYLPMLGVKRSFNAAVAFGIAAYLLRKADVT